MAEPFVFTVRQLTRYLRGLIERDRTLGDLWVRGEISNFVHHSSGHLYFTLKDEGAQVRCVFFRDQARSLTFDPADGMRVVAHGGMSVYEARGTCELIVSDLQADGTGALFLAFEELKRHLEAEGLFDPARKRPLPSYPRRVALLTSLDGAVVHDFVTLLDRRWPVAQVVLIAMPVSGAQSAPGIVRALEMLKHVPNADLAVLARGGGSIEELWGFNQEAVALAIAGAPVPVVSAIGHETDFTIADFVADLRAPTPSAATEMIAPDWQQVAAGLDNLTNQVWQAVAHRVAMERAQLDGLLSRRVLQSPLGMLAEWRQRLDELCSRAAHNLGTLIHGHQHFLAKLNGKLSALDPKAILQRGYSLVRRLPEGRLVREKSQVAPGDRARITVSDGDLTCVIETVQ